MKQDVISNTRLHNALILVVDDMEVNRAILLRSLSNRGYNNVVTAVNGLQAMQMTHDLKPDLVILDLVMPEMDGFAYCQAIRRDPAFDTMPILVQTMLEKIEDKLKAFYLGASDYICKPIDPDELGARTQVHLMAKMMIADLHDYRERIMAEMSTAQAMQNRLMPDSRAIEMCERIFNMKIAAHFETSMVLGGDCWGMKPLSDKRLAIYSYDFSGHGVSAAINVFRMHTLMQECLHASGEPGYFLSQLNHHLYPLLERNEFATMFYGIIDTDANCLQYATAATPSPALITRNHTESTLLSGRGLPLAAMENTTYKTKYTPFMADDMLLLFSDCLTETPNEAGEFLSENSIKEHACVIMQDATNPAKQTIEGLTNFFRSYICGPISDDMTITAYWRSNN